MTPTIGNVTGANINSPEYKQCANGRYHPLVVDHDRGKVVWGARWALLKNPDTLTETQAALLKDSVGADPGGNIREHG